MLPSAAIRRHERHDKVSEDQLYDIVEEHFDIAGVTATDFDSKTGRLVIRTVSTLFRPTAPVSALRTIPADIRINFPSNLTTAAVSQIIADLDRAGWPERWDNPYGTGAWVRGPRCISGRYTTYHFLAKRPEPAVPGKGPEKPSYYPPKAHKEWLERHPPKGVFPRFVPIGGVIFREKGEWWYSNDPHLTWNFQDGEWLCTGGTTFSHPWWRITDPNWTPPVVYSDETSLFKRVK